MRALAIAARPALADVLSALARPSIPLPSVRQGARFLATMCQEAHDAKGLSIRRKIRLRLYEEASPLLYGAFGRRAAADEQAARDIALALAAFASEPELALRLGVDGAARCGSLASWCVQCARECALRPSRLSARPPPPVVPTYGSLSALGSCTAHRHGCLVALRARDAPRRRAHQRGGEARSQPAPVRGACAALIRSPTTLISNEALRLAQCRSVRRQGGVCRAAWSRAGGHAHLARSSNHVSVLFRSVALRV